VIGGELEREGGMDRECENANGVPLPRVLDTPLLLLSFLGAFQGVDGEEAMEDDEAWF